MWQRRFGRGDGFKSHNAHRDRHTGIQQHCYRAIALGRHCGFRIERHDQRLGDPLQRQLHFLGHYAQLRLGDHYDPSRIACRGLRYAYREVHPG